ncbi:MAG TPA: hypothetical protein VMV29_21080 [Ktedonobacterales bacterium]|nr:hypothetical protein [Ktedonobacterales bacterium]
MLLAVALVAAGCGGTPPSVGAIATTAPGTQTSGGGVLGAAPLSCPSAASLSLINASLGSGIGSPPVWGVGLSGSSATLHLGANAVKTANGWQGAIKWVATANAHGPIVIQGQLMEGDYPPVWFQSGTQQATTEIILDQAHPGPGSTSAFSQFPTTIWVPQAGCYQITVNWYTGSWSAVVGIGR